MHVPWSWIKQRPHFIAEELSNFYILSVFAEKEKNGKVPYHDIYKIRFLSYLSIPKINNYFVALLNYWLRKLFYSWHTLFNDIIWITYPVQWGYVKHSINKSHLIVYDCMDDMESFYSDSITKKKIRNLESSICDRADVILVSALSLKHLLEDRCLIKNKITVVNNAIINTIQKKNIHKLNNYFSNLIIDESYFNILYVGTISSWFDFESVLFFLNNDSHCRTILFGPKDVDIPVHPRLLYGGILPHSDVFDALCLADLLLMPFLLTPTVMSVNPVKAYEYISSTRPVALIRYPETEYFAEFVNLYNTQEELFSIIQEVKNNGNYIIKTTEECEAFNKANTWSERCKNIKALLDSSSHIR